VGARAHASVRVRLCVKVCMSVFVRACLRPLVC